MINRNHRLLAALLGGCAALVASAAVAQSTPPQIVTVPIGSHPPIPAGLKATCTPNPDTGAHSATCPVIRYGGFTTWAYSFIDNRVAFAIVSYDAQGAVVQNLTRNGARYVYNITSNPTAQTVSIWGQSNAKVDLAWSDLPQPPAPPAGPVYAWTPASAPPANVVTAPSAPAYPVCRATDINSKFWVGWWDGSVCHGSYGNMLQAATGNLQFLTLVSGSPQWTTTPGPTVPSVPPGAISGGPTPMGDYDQRVCAYNGYIGWVYETMCEHNGPHTFGGSSSVLTGALQ